MPIRRVLLVLVMVLGAAVGCGGDSDEPTSAGPSWQAPSFAESGGTERAPTAAATTREGTVDRDPDEGGSPEGQGKPDQEEGTGNEPGPEGEGPEKPAPEIDRPYAKLAPAPVGSNDNSTGPVNKRFCVGVSLLRTPPDGLTVKVTGVGLNRTDMMRLPGGTCQGRPSCKGYTFGSENAKCSVVVIPTRADPEGLLPETRLTVSGQAYCAAGAEDACAEWVRDADGFDERTIALFLPSEPEPTTSGPDSGEPADPTTNGSTDG
ncbi:hypothetical protein QLQ12_35885 [Actinoplanes sp. NEAU-A12]|uniref:Secreted protein n=1 Tax=Actinoplanes sandaracinus TaxID=3045177 RepID=A0ABT6WWJ4_9ACTN|nr:hypothetical protein [Actinoplanes sandaracinus]MDI6103985.1 hypothetical protein [Actinoplanes sandaracinus]